MRISERIAHAFDPAGWKRRSLAFGIVLFGFVLAVTVLQRALVADTATEWLITGVHGVVVIVVVPMLSTRTLREWRRRNQGPLTGAASVVARQPSQGPIGVPEKAAGSPGAGSCGRFHRVMSSSASVTERQDSGSQPSATATTKQS